MKSNRVVITGLGAISGLGHNVADNWKNIINGQSGISKVEHNDIHTLSIQIAGEVKNFTIPEELLSEKESRRYDKFIQYGLFSADEAIKDSKIQIGQDYDPEKVGCIIGVGIGGFPKIEENYNLFTQKGARRVSPFFIPSIIPNMVPGLISIRYNLQGSNFSISSACASASHAITSSYYEIASGKQDAIVTGGAESAINNLPYSAFINMKALSKNQEDPTKASRPFDSKRDGFVMGEGAGILVLENYEKAKKRNAKIYAEIIGTASTSDAHHITSPHLEGDGAYRCMKLALKDANISHEKIDYINAHGTSTPLGDLAETKAIKKCFSEHAYNLKVSSTKSMTGHLLGASGGIETIFSAKALETGILPPTINLENPDKQCDLNYIPNKSIEHNIEYALTNSFGFGGTNSTLILKKV